MGSFQRPITNPKPAAETKNPDLFKIWRLVRVVEGARLESVYTRKGIEGSNPSVSASSSVEKEIRFTSDGRFLNGLK